MAAPAKLSHDLIVNEAIVLLRDDGLEKVTLRRLAARLGVEAPSLYKHIGSKQELLALVTVRLFGNQIEQVGSCATWQEWLIAFGKVLWSTQTRIPDSATLVATTAFTRDQIEEMSRKASASLIAHGVEPSLARDMHLSVQIMILGLSALAEGKSGRLVRDAVAIDALLDQSLNALVCGWELTQSDARHGAKRRNNLQPSPDRI